MSYKSLERIFHGLSKNDIINCCMIYFDPSLASLKMGTKLERWFLKVLNGWRINDGRHNLPEYGLFTYATIYPHSCAPTYSLAWSRQRLTVLLFRGSHWLALLYAHYWLYNFIAKFSITQAQGELIALTTSCEGFNVP